MQTNGKANPTYVGRSRSGTDDLPPTVTLSCEIKTRALGHPWPKSKSEVM